MSSQKDYQVGRSEKGKPVYFSQLSSKEQNNLSGLNPRDFKPLIEQGKLNAKNSKVVHAWYDLGDTPEDQGSKIAIIKSNEGDYSVYTDGKIQSVSVDDAINLYIISVDSVNENDLAEKFGALSSKKFILQNMPISKEEVISLKKEIFKLEIANNSSKKKSSSNSIRM